MYGINYAKSAFIAVTGAVGGFVAELLGGWDNDIKTLVIFMIVDYIMGIIIAAFFKRSDKTDSGALSSKACWVGLCRKGITLLIVLVAHRLDLLIGTSYIRSAAVIGFCCSELVSIVENAGLMGLPLPAVIAKAIDILKTKEDN